MHLHILILQIQILYKVINFIGRDDNRTLFLQYLNYTFVSALYESGGESFAESMAFQRIRGCPLQEYPYSRFYCIHLYIIDTPFTAFSSRVIVIYFVLLSIIDTFECTFYFFLLIKILLLYYYHIIQIYDWKIIKNNWVS